ncbi:MAG: sulfurtransferase [Ilumatobacteraceae bacterium]
MMDCLVDTGWLAAHLGEPGLVVLDCTVRFEPTTAGTSRIVSGREAYEACHIPGAGFADLIRDLSDASSELSFAVPTPQALCAALGAIGVGDASRVVLYDTTISAWAARVWWMMKWVGFDNAAVLDGGLRAWVAEGRATAAEPTAPVPEVLTPRVRPELIAHRDEVRDAIADCSVVLVDSLPAGQFSGAMPMYDRPGHIPGAVNVPVLDLIDDTGRFRPLPELAALHPFDPGMRTITYCGGGIAASSNALILTKLGFRDVAVYTASLQEWTADGDNPLTTENE